MSNDNVAQYTSNIKRLYKGFDFPVGVQTYFADATSHNSDFCSLSRLEAIIKRAVTESRSEALQWKGEQVLYGFAWHLWGLRFRTTTDRI
eukprot:717392-Amphidinium_carterae.1